MTQATTTAADNNGSVRLLPRAGWGTLRHRGAEAVFTDPTAAPSSRSLALLGYSSKEKAIVSVVQFAKGGLAAGRLAAYRRWQRLVVMSSAARGLVVARIIVICGEPSSSSAARHWRLACR